MARVWLHFRLLSLPWIVVGVVGDASFASGVSTAKKRNIAGDDQAVAAADDAQSQLKQHPSLVASYRLQAQQYEKAAEESAETAKQWAQKTKALLYYGKSQTSELTKKELKRRHVGVWASSAWKVQEMLDDPRPAYAIAAGEAAAKPYLDAYQNYQETSGEYAKVAKAFALRANTDAATANQLAAYANQYRLEGDETTGGRYAHQSKELMHSAENYEGSAVKYNKIAKKINQALPVIAKMADAERANTEWRNNPNGGIPAEHVYTLTLAPPIDGVQGSLGSVFATAATSFLQLIR